MEPAELTSIDVFIAFGRKIEDLRAQNASFDLGDGVLEYDQELRVLLATYLRMAEMIIAQSFIDPASDKLLNDERFQRLLLEAVVKYLPDNIVSVQ